MDNQEDMHKFLESYNLQRLNQEEIENMNRPITSNEIETVIKNFPTERGASRWRMSKMWRSPSFPQIHQKYIYMWNNPYRTPTERWQKISDLTKDKISPRTWVGQKKKEKTETKE